jgi:hypothetical protein
MSQSSLEVINLKFQKRSKILTKYSQLQSDFRYSPEEILEISSKSREKQVSRYILGISNRRSTVLKRKIQ